MCLERIGSRKSEEISVSNMVANGMEVNMETPGSVDRDGSVWMIAVCMILLCRRGRPFRCRGGEDAF